jgi:hypothetical protein
MFLFAGCSSWTEPESEKINNPGIETQNPELYEEYLSNLREYRNTNHKTTIAWFDNSCKFPINQSQHVSALPDSLDYVSLMYPDNLSEDELNEIAMIREKKGMKVIFTIDFDNIKLKYDTWINDLMQNEETIDEPENFNLFLLDTVKSSLALVDKYNYDGICVSYNGKPKLYMSQSDKIKYSGYENAFLGIAEDWHARNMNKIMIFKGKPQNVINQEIFENCLFIVIPCLDVVSTSGMTYNLVSACSEGVPPDRFIPLLATNSIDESDKKTGYWENGINAIDGASSWLVKLHSGFTISGMAFYNSGNDYYNPSYTYNHIRNAIATINPSVKK